MPISYQRYAGFVSLALVFVTGCNEVTGTGSRGAPAPSVGQGCSGKTGSTVYSNDLKGWVTIKYQEIRTTQDIVRNGIVYRQTVVTCHQRECVKLDPDKLLTAAQAAAACT